MMDLCKELFEKLNSSNVRYCHFKSNNNLMMSLEGKEDLDIIVSGEDYSCFEDIITCYGFVECERNIFCSYPGVTNWYGYDKKNGSIIHIHLHTKLITGKGLVKDYILPWESQIINNAVINELGIKVNNPNIELILLFTRLVVKRKITDRIKSTKREAFIPDDEWEEVLYLRKRICEPDFKNYYCELIDEQTYSIFKNMMTCDKNIDKREFCNFERHIKTKLKRNRRFNPVVAEVLSVLYRVKRKINVICNEIVDLAFPVKNRICGQGGIFALVGIDGSGKSTISKEIIGWLDTYFDVKRYYFGAGDGNCDLLINVLIKGYQYLVRKKVVQEQDRGSSERVNVENGEGLGYVKACLASIAYVKLSYNNYRSMRKAKRFCNKGGIVICDRFPQSMKEVLHDGPLIDRYRRAYPKSFLIRKLALKEKRLFEKMDNIDSNIYVIRLNVDPIICYQRKKENEGSEMDRIIKAEQLGDIKYINATETVEVDGNDELRNVVLNVKTIIWDRVSNCD